MKTPATPATEPTTPTASTPPAQNLSSLPDLPNLPNLPSPGSQQLTAHPDELMALAGHLSAFSQSLHTARHGTQLTAAADHAVTGAATLAIPEAHRAIELIAQLSQLTDSRAQAVVDSLGSISQATATLAHGITHTDATTNQNLGGLSSLLSTS